MDSSDNEKREDFMTEKLASDDDDVKSLASDESSEGSLKSKQTNKARAEKPEAIRQACDSRDIEALVSYATTEGGLLEDEVRRRACKVQCTREKRSIKNNKTNQGPFCYNVMKSNDTTT